jgi:multiple sugar transport system ATP-binding protein
MTMADKIVVMRDGVIEQMGSPLDLYDHPNNIFVAGFIGSPSMNFIEGSVSNGTFTTKDGIALPSVNPPATATTYGIRPEHLQLADDGIEIEVVVLEPTGSETQVIGRLGAQSINGIFRERVNVAPGSRIKVKPDISLVHLFDKDGKRVN